MENIETYPTAEQLKAVVRKLGGYQGVISFLRGETLLVKNSNKWREQDGVFYFSVTSDGTTGEEWITRLEEKGFSVNSDAKKLLLSDDFKPTSGVTTEVAVLKSNSFSSLKIKNIVAESIEFGYSNPNAEVACLLREMISDEEMMDLNVWSIVIMHQPIQDPNCLPGWLVVTVNIGNSCLGVGFDHPDHDIKWDRSCWFAYVIPQATEV